MALDIRELEIDDENEAKAAAHGVSARELFQLLDDDFVVLRNRRDRKAPYVLAGRTHGGRLIVAPIVESAVEGRWRPITAWEPTEAQRARYNL